MYHVTNKNAFLLFLYNGKKCFKIRKFRGKKVFLNVYFFSCFGHFFTSVFFPPEKNQSKNAILRAASIAPFYLPLKLLLHSDGLTIVFRFYPTDTGFYGRPCGDRRSAVGPSGRH